MPRHAACLASRLSSTSPSGLEHTQQNACRVLNTGSMKPTWYSGTGSRTTPVCPGHLNHELRHVAHRMRRSDGPNAGSLGPSNFGRFLAYTACSVTTLAFKRSISSGDRMPNWKPTTRGYSSDTETVPASDTTEDEQGAQRYMAAANKYQYARPRRKRAVHFL